MTALAPSRFLCAIVFLSVVGSVAADPLADLLPPQTRQLEKRTLIGGDRDEMRMYYRGGGNGRPGAAISSDGKYLAVSHPNTGLVLWDLALGRNLGPLSGLENSQGSTIAFAPDGKHFVTVSMTYNRHGNGSFPVTLWDAKKRERVRSLDDDANDALFMSLAFSPDGKTLALAGGFNNRRGNPNPGIHLWDVATGDEIRRIDNLVPIDPARRLSGVIQSMTYSPDGRTLALLADGRLILMETATSKIRTQIVVGQPLDVRQEQNGEMPLGSIAFSPDGRTLAIGGSDGTIRRFEVKSGREMPPLAGHAMGIIALGFSHDGKTILSLGADQKLFFWSADANREWRPKAIQPNEQTLERLWDTLRTDDPLDLYGVSQLLSASPESTVAFLRKRLTPMPKGDTERMDKLVADLQKEYNDRKKAKKELEEKFGALAVPSLRKVADTTGDPFVRELMMRLESQTPPREQQRAVRALEILERIGSDDARKLLDELAKGAPEASFTLAAKAAYERSTKVGGGAAPKLEALWDDLSADDSSKSFASARRLAAQPEDAVPFLRDRLLKLAASDAFDTDPKRVAKLLTDLDSEEFETRDQASKALKTLGKLIEPSLRLALDAKPSAEVKRQVEEILAEVSRQSQSAEVLRTGRTLEVLEWIGTAASRQALEALAKESRGAWMREEAAAALRRHGL